jgi:hypothetical protein
VAELDAMALDGERRARERMNGHVAPLDFPSDRRDEPRDDRASATGGRVVQAEPGRVRSGLVNVRTMPEPVEAGRWIADGLIRPRTVGVLAAAEGIGKSWMRKNAEHCLASGRGPLFGRFPIPGPVTVATFEEENGAEEEWRRDERMIATLGIDRADLGDRLHRVSTPGLDLTNADDQAYVRAEVKRVGAEVTFFDTGGSMIGEEWGAPIKVAMRFLHSLPSASIVSVHLVKPSRNGTGSGRDHGSVLSDVMGQWTRSADVVALVSDLGGGRVRMIVRKRVPHVELILAQRDGAWDTVAIGPLTAPSTTATDDRVMRAIAAGATSADLIRTALTDNDRRLPERTFYDAIRRLRTDGLVAEGTPLALTDAGWEAVE